MGGIRKHKPRTAKASAATASKLQKSNYITHPAAAIGWILASGEYIEASRHKLQRVKATNQRKIIIKGKLIFL